MEEKEIKGLPMGNWPLLNEIHLGTKTITNWERREWPTSPRPSGEAKKVWICIEVVI